MGRYQGKTTHLIGRQKLEFYCQLCHKQCRDANGFKNHIASPSHQAKLGDNAGGSIVENYSRQFQRDFLRLLKSMHGTKQVEANKFYQEYIAAKDHIHMNATRWRSLTSFVKFLGRHGIAKVDFQGDSIAIALVDVDEAERTKRAKELAEKEAAEEAAHERVLEKRIEEARGKSEQIEVETVTKSGPVRMVVKKKGAVKKKGVFDE